MKTLTHQYLRLSERIKFHMRIASPKEPSELIQTLHHRYPPIVPFTVYTMLFSGEMRLNGFGECVSPAEISYEPEETRILPVHFPNR